MGDRVAIIGGKTVGRDHFPFGTVDASFSEHGDNTFRPFTVDLATMCKFFYVVKKWRFSMEFDFAWDGLDGPEAGEGSIQFDLVPRMRTGPDEFELEDWSREAQVVQARSGVRCIFTLRTDGTGNAGIEEGDEIPFTVDNVIGSSSSTSDDFNTSGEDYFVGELDFDLSDMAFESGFMPNVALRFDNIDATNQAGRDGTGGGSYANGRFYLDQDGFAQYAQIYGKAPPIGTSASPYINAAGHQINLAPVEFWPYATKPIYDGSGNVVGGNLPVYDTSTGAELTDPLG